MIQSDHAKEGIFTVNGRIEGTQLTTKLHVRVSAQTGAKKIFLTNGPVQNCHWPLLQTQIQLILFQTSTIIDFFNDRPANRWTNWNRSNPEASVGVLFEIQVF